METPNQQQQDSIPGTPSEKEAPPSAAPDTKAQENNGANGEEADDATTSGAGKDGQETAEAADGGAQPTEEEMKAVSPLGGLFPKWDRHNQSTLKIILYCLLFVVILTVLGYFLSR